MTCCTYLTCHLYMPDADISNLSQCLTSSMDTCISHKAFSFLSSLHNNSRHTSQFDFSRPRTRTDYYQTSYVPSVISAWNNLPVVVKSPCTVSSFNVNYETPRDLPSRGVKDAQFVSCVSCDIRCQLFSPSHHSLCSVVLSNGRYRLALLSEPLSV